LDNVTHTLFGATLARAAFGSMGRGATTALVLASNAPDIDIVTTSGGALNYLAWHRGPTHGPLGVITLGLATAALVWAAQRRLDRDRRAEHASYPTLAGVAMVGVVAHILMDLPTSYGTRLLSPFSWRWHAVDLMPIVDIYLVLVLAAALIVGWRLAGLKRRLALAALAFLVLDYGLRAAAHHRAMSVTARLMAPMLPAPCADAVRPSPIDAWPVETLADRRDRAARRCLMEIAAIPTFVSPFRWQMIARLSDSYQILDLDLMDARLSSQAAVEGSLAIWRSAVRYPDQWTPAVLRAATSRVGRVYLEFSRFPAASSVLNDDNTATVNWADMRFAGSAAPVPRPRAGLFTATVTVDARGRAISEHLGR
jgi:inner membrane protein